MTAHFGVDDMFPFDPPEMEKMRVLAAGAHGHNGRRWSDVEPVLGAGYGNPAGLIALYDSYKAIGAKIHVSFQPYHADALETGIGNHQDPDTGVVTPNYLRLKSEHHVTWENFVEWFATTFDGHVDYWQIGNEPHYHWEQSEAGSEGFAEMIRLAYPIVKANSDMKVVTCGMSPGENFFLVDDAKLAYIATLSPADQAEWADNYANHNTQRQWCERFFVQSDGKFDILALHFNFLPATPIPQVAWARAQMSSAGYSRPIFSDDASSAMVIEKFWNTFAEFNMWTGVQAGVQSDVEAYAAHQSNNAVKKLCYGFAAGTERIFLTGESDLPETWTARWRYQGMLRAETALCKPFYWTYKMVIAALDQWVTVQQVSPTVFKFTFTNKAPIIVAWAETPGVVDLSGGAVNADVHVTPIVTQLNQSGDPVYPPVVTASNMAVPVGLDPVLVEVFVGTNSWGPTSDPLPTLPTTGTSASLYSDAGLGEQIKASDNIEGVHPVTVAPRDPNKRRPAPAPTLEERFGVDDYNGSVVVEINEMGAKSIGYNGLTWNAAEPTPGNYGDISTLAAIAAALHAAGVSLQLNLRPDHDTMMEHGEGTYANPANGDPIPRLLRVFPQYRTNWTALITKMVTEVAPEFLQISSEAENSFEASAAGATGLAELVALAYDATRGTNTKILACGWAFDDKILIEGALQEYIQNYGTATEKAGLKQALAALAARRLFLKNFLSSVQGKFDVMTWHANFTIDEMPLTTAWLRVAMTAAGAESKPIWMDDVQSVPFYSSLPTLSSAADLLLQTQMQNGNPAAITEYGTRQARTVVQRTCAAGAAGVGRIWFTWSKNILSYFLPRWKYAGFMDENSVKKPAYYAYQELISQINYWTSADLIEKPKPISLPGVFPPVMAGKWVYRFKVPGKADRIVAWTDLGNVLADLSYAVSKPNVTVRTFVTALSGSDPIIPDDVTVLANQVVLTNNPVVLWGV